MRFFLFIFFPLFSFGFVDFAFGQNPEKITSYPSRDFQSGVSGNNRFLAFVSDRNGNDEIWLKDLLANRFSVPKQLTNHPAPDFSPSLNKDGTKLLYVSKKSDPRGDIYLLDRVTGVETRLTDMESEDSEPHWGADERTVYYLKYDYTLNQKTLFKYSLPEKKEVSLFRERVHSFCILKGGWIIYSDGRNILAVNENDLKKRQTLTTGKFIDIFPSTFDGTAVFFVRYPEKSNFDSTFSGEEGSSLWAVTTDSVSMERRRLFQITPNSSGTLYPAPTQKNLYYSDEAGGNIFRLKIQNFFKPYYSYETATKHVELLLESGKSVRALMVMGNMSRNTIRPGDQKKWEHFNFEFIRRLISAEKINQARNTLTTLHELSEGGKTLRDVFTKKITALQTMQSLSNVDKKKVAKNAVKEMLQTGQNHKTDPYLFGTLLIESGNLLAAIGDHADALDLLNKAARLQKEEIQARALFSKATIYKVAGNLSGMTALFVEIAQKLGPNSSWGKQAIADAISASEQGESLKEKLLSLREFSKKHSALPSLQAASIFRQSRLLALEGESLKALTRLDEILSHPEDIRLWKKKALVEKANIYREREEFAKAAETYELLLSSSPEKSQERYEFERLKVFQKVAEAHRLQQSGDVKVAAKAFRVLLTQYPDSVEGHRGYIQSKVALKKYEELESFYKSELKKKEGSAVLEYALGLTLTYAKPPKIKEAIRHLENAVNKDQSVAYFHQTLGWAYEQYEKFGKKRGFLEKAIGEYMAALELNDVLEFPDVEGNLLLNTGNSWFALGNFFQAFRFYSQRETFPQQFPSKTTEMLFRKNFGETCFKTGRSTCAVDQFQKAIALLGKGENALLQKAELLERIGLAFQDIEKYSKAVHYFSHALEIALQLGLKKNISLLQRNIGVNLYNMSLAPKEIERKHLIQALNHYLRAIQLVGKYGVKEQKKGKGLINIDTGLGEKTSTHARGFDKEGEEKLLFGYIANTYEKLSETESSIKYYMKKISRFPKTLSPEENAALLSEKGVLLNRMGLLNYSAGNVEKAKEDLLSSLHICVSLGLKRGARINLFNISKIFAQLLFLEKETNPEEVLSFLRISRDFFSSESESSRDFYIFSNLALLAYISYTPPQEASNEPITDDFVKQFYDQYRFLGDALYFYKRAISGVKQDEALPSGQKTNLLMHLNLNLLAIYQQNGLDELALQTRVELEAAKKAGNALSGWVYTFFQSKKAPPKLRANLLKEAADTLLKTPLPVKKKGEVLQFLPLLKALKTDLVENLVEGGKVSEAFSYLEKLDKRIVTLKLFHELGEDVFFQGISGEYSVELRAILDEWKTGIKNGEGKKILELEPLFEETIFSLYDENPSSVSLLFQYDPPVQNLSKVITEEGAYLKIMEGKKGFHFFLLKNRKFSYVNLSKKQNKTLDIGEFSSSLSETSSIYVSGPQKILKRVRDEYLQEKSITHVNNFYNILDAHQRRNLFVSKGFSTGKFTLDNNLVDEDLFPPVKTLRKDFVTNKDLFTDSNFFVGTLPLNSTAGYRFKEKEGLHRTLRLSDISPVYGHTAFLLNIPKAQKKHVDIWVESLLKTGFAHVVINNSPFSKANAEKFVSLYLSYIADLPAAEALAVAQQDISEWAGERADFSLYGYSGMDEEEKKTLASRTYLKELENAVTHFKKKAYGSALKGFENALRVSKIAGKEGDTKKLLTLLVESAFKTGDYHTAILFQKRLVSLSKSDDPAEKANAAFTLGTLYSRAGNYDRAVVLIEDAITFWKKNDELDELAKGASTLGIVRENMGEYSAAFQQFSSTSELFQELGEGTGVADMYRKMGRINYLRRGRYEEARKNFEFANGVYLELNNVKGVVETYFEIGFTYEKMGLFEKADRFYTKGINLSKTLPEQTLMAKGKLYLGNTNWFRGEYQKSFSYLSEAEELAHQKDTAFQIMAENTKGLIFWTLNEPKKALTHVNKAISFSRTQKISSELATSLNNAGLIYRQSGKIEKSIEMFQKALEIDTSLKNKWGLGYDHRNLGISQMRLKHYEKAEKHLTLAETMSEEIKNRPNHVKSLLELGNLNLETGKTEKALSFYQNAYEASVKYYLKEVSWRAAYKQGIIQKKKGNLEEALKWFKTAISIVEKMRAGIKIEELQNSFQENKISLYKDAIVLLVNMGQTDAAFNYVERSRSRSFIDLLGNKKITVKNNSDQKELEKVQSLFLKIETITRELGAYDSPPKKLLEKLEENKTRYEEALIEIKRKNPQLSSFVSVEPLTLEELKDILDEKLGALTYMLTDDEVLIWLITKKKTLFFRSRTELSETTKLVKQYRTGIQNLEPVDNELKRLYQILIEPVAKEIDQLENLAIIPDGALHYLSFSALNKGDGYLIDKIPLFYLPSASVFKFTFAKRTNKTFEKVKVLAVGNPDLGSFNYDLPMAELEAGSIKWTFPEVDLLTREKATEKWIVDNIDKYNIIHIASHGEFNTLDPLLSALMFASESSEPASLTVQEIFSLNLKADIVTLSACQTGLGKLKAGELIGLNRAFMYAGTHSLISSLWRVDDLSTALLMKYFYRFLPQHDKGSSLRKAQLLVKKNFPHPAYWSGFSLVGDYR